LAAFFGLQSMQAYSVFGWFAQVYRDAGFSAATAGILLGVITAMSIPLSLWVPAKAARMENQRWLVVGLIGCYPVGYLGLIFAPVAGAWVWAVFVGAAAAVFPLVLTLIGLRARTGAGTAALSGFTQSVGYLMAALGPLFVGVLYDLTGGWTAPLSLLLALVVPQLVAGLIVSRPSYIEDHLVRRAARSGGGSVCSLRLLQRMHHQRRGRSEAGTGVEGDGALARAEHQPDEPLLAGMGHRRVEQEPAHSGIAPFRHHEHVGDVAPARHRALGLGHPGEHEHVQHADLPGGGAGTSGGRLVRHGEPGDPLLVLAREPFLEGHLERVVHQRAPGLLGGPGVAQARNAAGVGAAGAAYPHGRVSGHGTHPADRSHRLRRQALARSATLA
jgi:hypothetical protein